jgi:hypothetical protein
MTAMKDFFQKLQSLDEPVKQRILVAATIVIMVVVLYFWLMYFNGIVAGARPEDVADNATAGDAMTGQSAAQQGAAGAVTGEEGMGPWQVVGRRIAFVYGGFMNMVRGLGNILQAPRQYIVRPPQ